MNFIKKINKKILLSWVNNLSGTRCFGLKRGLLNMCSGIHVGKKAKIVGPIYIPVIGSLEIGAESWIGKNLRIEGNGDVHIGERCDLAPNITLVTGSHKIGTEERRAGEGYNAPISIGNGCWICANALILPNVTIGDSSIVGAGALVNKDVPSNCAYAGNPAKEIKKLPIEGKKDT